MSNADTIDRRQLGQNFQHELQQLINKYRKICVQSNYHPNMLYYYLNDFDMRPFTEEEQKLTK